MISNSEIRLFRYLVKQTDYNNCKLVDTMSVDNRVYFTLEIPFRCDLHDIIKSYSDKYDINIEHVYGILYSRKWICGINHYSSPIFIINNNGYKLCITNANDRTMELYNNLPHRVYRKIKTAVDDKDNILPEPNINIVDLSPRIMAAEKKFIRYILRRYNKDKSSMSIINPNKSDEITSYNIVIDKDKFDSCINDFLEYCMAINKFTLLDKYILRKFINKWINKGVLYYERYYDYIFIISNEFKNNKSKIYYKYIPENIKHYLSNKYDNGLE